MKILCTILLACTLSSASRANILTVSNNATYPGQYNTVQDAVNAAAAGDTIYVYPSSSAYPEGVNIAKRLVIIGGGISPQRPNRLSTYVYRFVLTGPSASGSILMGLNIYGWLTSGADGNPVNNLILSECAFNNSTVYGSNVLIENCILPSSYSTGGILFMSSYGSSGNIIQNNYIHGGIALRPGTNTIIRNNIFASGDANTLAFADIQWGEAFGAAVKIYNNIFFKTDPVGPRAVSDACEFKNNLYYLTGDPPPVNAQSSGNINADPQFVNFPAAGAGFSLDYDYHLQASSPAINYGIDGRDLGIWGGSAPVNTGFEPPIPRIYELSVNNAVVAPGGTVQLKIKATKAQ